MTTWNSLSDYVRRNYKVAEEKPGMIRMIFDMGEMRSQMVYLWQQTLFDGREEWLQIESPFGSLDSIDIDGVLRAAGDLVCGGVASVESTLTFRHSVPMENMDINEFERPLMLVTSTADNMERRFTGGDRF